MRKKTRLLTGLALGTLFTLGGTTAFASPGYTNYDVLLPNLQQGVTTAIQNKTSNDDALARVSFIGSDYRVNLRTVRGNGGQSGDEIKGAGRGLYRLNTPFAPGAQVGLQLFNSTWSLTRVQVTGNFSAR